MSSPFPEGFEYITTRKKKIESIKQHFDFGNFQNKLVMIDSELDQNKDKYFSRFEYETGYKI